MARTYEYMDSIVPWFHMDDRGVIFNTNGSLQITFKYRGIDHVSLENHDLATYNRGLNNIFRRLKTGAIIYVENQRNITSLYHKNSFPSELMKILEEERRDFFENNNFYMNEYFLTYVYKIPTSIFNSIEKIFSFDESNQSIFQDFVSLFKEMSGVGKEQSLSYFSDEQIDQLNNQLNILSENFYKEATLFKKSLEYYLPSLDFLTKEEQLKYLHSTVSTDNHYLRASRDSFLASFLCDQNLQKGTPPKLGDLHLGVISIMDFPDQSHAFILETLNNIKSEYRWVSRYVALSKEDAIKTIKEREKKWTQQARSFTGLMFAKAKYETGEIDTDAIMQAGDSIDAYEDVAGGRIGLGHYTMTFSLLNENKETLLKDIEKVVAVINTLGFTARYEKYNAVNAFFGSIPGCYSYNLRRSLISSLNFVFTLPTASKWTGEETNKFLNDRPLFQCVTEGNMPFYFNLHVDDIGHGIIVGATGTGKSVLLNMIAVNFTKYKNSQVFIFDKSASSRVPTKAIGGNFYNLLVDTDELSFQPLANTDEEKERQWAGEWLIQFLEMQHEPLTSSERNMIYEGLHYVGRLKKEERTLSNFVKLLQEPELRERLQILTNQGAYGKLFDSNVDRFGEGSWQAFEMEEIMNTPTILTPTLNYLFHRIEGQLDGKKPSLIVLDESWLFLDNELFKNKIRQFLKDLRKKNCSVILATQNLSDIKPDMMNVIVENCPTKIFLANPNAQNGTIKPLYQHIGLNETEIELLTELQARKEYFFTSPKGRRIIDLCLTPSELDFLASTSKADQNEVQRLENASPSLFIEEWMKYKSYGKEQREVS